MSIRGSEKHYGLVYDTRAERIEDGEWGKLVNMDLASDDVDLSFTNLPDLFDFLEKQQTNIYVVMPDLLIFASYLVTEILDKRGHFIDEYRKSPKQMTKDNNKPYDWRWSANSRFVYFIQIKLPYGATVLTFVDAGSKLKEKSVLKDITAAGLYQLAEDIEKDFPCLFYGINGSFGIEKYAIQKFLERGNNQKGFDNKELWYKNHPSEIELDDNRLRKIFIQQQASDRSHIYRPAMRSLGNANVLKYDCNNMYPYIMCTYKFPEGYATHVDGPLQTINENDSKIDIINKKPHTLEYGDGNYVYIHLLQGYRTCVADLDENEYPTELFIWLWSFELREMLRVNPELNYEVLEYYHFKRVCKFDKPHIEYFKHNYEIYHETGNKMFKSMNNVVYGKFSQRDIKKQAVPEVKDGRFDITSQDLEETHVPKHQYYPLGSAIIARGRVMISQIVHNSSVDLNDIVYIDTDSIAFRKTNKALEYLQSEPFVIGKQFGEWKLELDGELKVSGIKKYYGVGVDGKPVEANAGGGKLSEAIYYNPDTGESITKIKITNKKLKGGYVKEDRIVHTGGNNSE